MWDLVQVCSQQAIIMASALHKYWNKFHLLKSKSVVHLLQQAQPFKFYSCCNFCILSLCFTVDDICRESDGLQSAGV